MRRLAEFICSERRSEKEKTCKAGEEQRLCVSRFEFSKLFSQWTLFTPAILNFQPGFHKPRPFRGAASLLGRRCFVRGLCPVLEFFSFGLERLPLLGINAGQERMCFNILGRQSDDHAQFGLGF
jgi:hypothetical protein